MIASMDLNVFPEPEKDEVFLIHSQKKIGCKPEVVVCPPIPEWKPSSELDDDGDEGPTAPPDETRDDLWGEVGLPGSEDDA
ncbi:hypothetical protein SASPL_111360 [Salvia splendens]|uniref:Uncharacterized protein n=1 Tax=Salvia splendens TaxID=180675 RepID=A0A8X8Y7X8_SALSN|nr:hypothetical protein SASPL_111360 [Salvia splendens]